MKKLVELIEKTADNYGFESPLWDCKKITQLIREKFGKTIHFSNVWRLLKRFGLSPQKPKRQAKERDEKEVKEWIKNIWPKILAHARRWQAIIYFQDESAVRLTLKQVQKNHTHRKIIIIEDKAKPHIAKTVSQFVEDQKNKLAIYFLPSYSPELNPDEHVWAYLKGFKLKAHQTKSIKEFKPLVLSKMRSIQRKKEVVPSFFCGLLFD